MAVLIESKSLETSQETSCLLAGSQNLTCDLLHGYEAIVLTDVSDNKGRRVSNFDFIPSLPKSTSLDLASGMAASVIRTRQLLRIISFIIFLCILLYSTTSHLDDSNVYDLMIPLEAGTESTELIDAKCLLPNVDPFRADVMKLVRKLPPIKCNGKKRYGTVVGQQLRLDVSELRKAEMKYVRRPKEDDFSIKYSEAIQLDLNTAGNSFIPSIFVIL